MAHSHVSPLRGLTAKDIDSADDASQISLNSEEQSPNKRRRLSKKLHVAVAGCSHGEMDKIYASLAEIERIHGFKFDLLISCGDYQVRNYGDLMHMHVNKKYRNLQTFYRYYSGEMTAPVLTVFVGGNHEASGFLQELPNGGWVAPRIFYMGHANVVQFAGLRIAGLSGIFNKLHYDTGHWERPPFHECGGVVSAYHVRSVDVFRLKQLRPKIAAQRVDIMVSHDWPAGITDYGDVEDLLKKKPFFKEDIEKNALGNPATMIAHRATGAFHMPADPCGGEIRPRYWLAAHLHCKFAALVPHQKDCQETTEPEPTRFLSLDKPLPRRHFIQALEFDVDEGAEMKLSYDPVWLAILKATDSLTDATKRTTYMPSQCGSICGERWDYRPTEEEINRVQRLFEGDFTIPANFRKTAPPHDPSQIAESEFYYRNPQSSEFCAKLGIRDLNEMLCAQSKESLGVPYFLSESEDDAKNMGESIKTSHSDTEKFDGDCDFVIDRGHRSCPIYLTDFNAPKLLDSGSKDENEDEGNNGSDESAEPVEAVVEGKEGERGRRKVGSGIFRRRPMGVVVDEESD
ncbi:Lariat debranching enzyme [Toxocara canis]|uniref:Lariat debranching enzyme n=1 Tax=Toxocara canis TaxID=6265 RepID=A0A0B2VF71_TOXCA|nr:Lariat debranching enzyme [Toxocara canis]